MNKTIVAILCFVVATTAAAQEKPIRLYKGVAPGSENWTWDEKTIDVNDMKITLDVSKPTLVPYLPVKPNGTAVIIAPGGAFHALAVGHEGADVAKWLNEKGVTAFVLKYRLGHDDPAHPENNFVRLLQTGDFKKLDSINAVIVPLAMQDGLTAMKYVREHAAAYKIDPKKIGFMGFSAGGTVTMSVAYNATDETRPNFIAPIYAYEKAIIGSAVPSAKTPIFIAAATDDELGLASHSVHIYEKWVDAKQPAELHMYQKGKHGFGMRKQNIPTDKWIERFGDWLQMQGLL
jgi:acetyl esterase/lipase